MRSLGIACLAGLAITDALARSTVLVVEPYRFDVGQSVAYECRFVWEYRDPYDPSFKEQTEEGYREDRPNSPQRGEAEYTVTLMPLAEHDDGWFALAVTRGVADDEDVPGFLESAEGVIRVSPRGLIECQPECAGLADEVRRIMPTLPDGVTYAGLTWVAAAPMADPVVFSEAGCRFPQPVQAYSLNHAYWDAEPSRNTFILGLGQSCRVEPDERLRVNTPFIAGVSRAWQETVYDDRRGVVLQSKLAQHMSTRARQFRYTLIEPEGDEAPDEPDGQ